MFGTLLTRILPLVPKSVIGRIAQRYVAGEDLDSALATVGKLNQRGFRATLDILGEDSVDKREADRTQQRYRDILDRVADESLDSNISVKLTHLGLRVDADGARNRIFDLAEHAKQLDNFIRIDMEDSTITDATLGIQKEADSRYGNVGTVLQAALRRTENDASNLAAAGADLRLCKGIYRESSQVAYQRKERIRGSFVRTAEILMAAPGTYVAFATHDRELVKTLVERVEARSFPLDRCEFQVLLGVPMGNVLDDLASRGFIVRVYVPFGEEWYPYATRRLKENPRLATYVFRNMFTLEKKE